MKFPGLAAGWRRGPTQALPQVPGRGTSVQPLTRPRMEIQESRPWRGLQLCCPALQPGNQVRFALLWIQQGLRSSGHRLGPGLWEPGGIHDQVCPCPLGIHSPPGEADTDTAGPFKVNTKKKKKTGQFFMALKKKLKLVFSLPPANENFMLSQTSASPACSLGGTHPHRKWNLVIPGLR